MAHTPATATQMMAAVTAELPGDHESIAWPQIMCPHYQCQGPVEAVLCYRARNRDH